MYQGRNKIVIATIILSGIFLAGCTNTLSKDQEQCLESATAMYLQEYNYQKALNAPMELTPEQVSTINQHFNDYRQACTK